jgi:arylsulfatase A-like enzyme
MSKAKNDGRHRAGLLAVSLGVGLFLVIQFVLAVLKLGGTSNSMMNKFSVLAKDKHMDYLIMQNLYVGVGYVIVGILFVLVLRPFVALGVREGLRRPRVRAFMLSFCGCFLIHGFFILRLVKTRPYFLDEGKFGYWYYEILKAVPDVAKPSVYFILFTCLPLVVLGYALVWYWRNFSRSWRIAVAAVVLVLTGLMAIGSDSVRNRFVAKQQRDDKRWNVIIIGSDSLRADRLGCNGYKPRRSDGLAAGGASPEIDRLAKRSFNFQNFYVPIASTIESGTTLMTAQYPHSHGLRQMYPSRETLNDSKATIRPIAEILKEEGYDTAATGDWCAGYYDLMPLGFEDVSVSSYDNFKVYMSQAVVMSHFMIPLYFDNPVGYEIFPQLESFAQFVTPKVVTDRVKNRLTAASKSNKPFFWHVFYSCNHLPYRSPEPYSSMFTDTEYSGPNKNGVDFDIDQFIGGTDLENKWLALPEKEVRQIRDLYDGCTRMFDDNVGEILKALEESGLSERTIVIITADHGDNLYEEGVTLGHGLTFNGGLQANHVPLVFHVPGMQAKEVEEQVRLIDLIPTLADMLDLKKPEEWEGESFAGWLDGSEEAKSRAFYGETGFPFVQFRVEGVDRPKLPPMDEMTKIDEGFNFQFVLKKEYEERLVAAKQRCLVTEKWKLIYTPAADGSRHFGLFRRGEEGGREKDVSASHPEIFVAMKGALELWIDERVETSIGEIFPDGE